MLALTLIGTSAQTVQGADFAPEDRSLLRTYASDTWRSIEAMTPNGGLPYDALRQRNGGWEATGLTSPSNIAAYLWSTVAAAELGLISQYDAGRRLAPTLEVLSRLERSNGFFYNWYDPATGARAKQWPGGGDLRPFLSSVDNGWLAVALMLVANIRPDLRETADAILAPMNFGFFYNPYDPSNPVAHPGLLRGGYWPDEVAYTEFHYGTLNTEPRMASYVGIARGHLPPDHYYRMSRVAMGLESTSRTQMYANVAVAEGSLDYRGLRMVPSWDGTMFEALMVSLFVPEAEWAPSSWGVNHPLYVRAQIEHGLKDARLGYWGISASSDPDGGYHAFGVPGIGSWSRSNPVAAGQKGVVTPHASFLALRYAPDEALSNLRALASKFPVYSSYGFLDAVDVVSGRVSNCVLVLDQGMILAAIANALQDDVLHRGFASGPVETAIRPLIATEHFDAGIDVALRPPCEVGEPMARISTIAIPTLSRKDAPEAPTIPTPHLFLAEPGEAILENRPSPTPRRGTRKPRRRPA